MAFYRYMKQDSIYKKPDAASIELIGCAVPYIDTIVMMHFINTDNVAMPVYTEVRKKSEMS